MAKKTRAQARDSRHARVRKRLVGLPERPRLNVFKSLTGIYAQIIDDSQGNT
ncbi:50S ribosomal protein L18, partial [Streptococcus pyogenes]